MTRRVLPEVQARESLPNVEKKTIEQWESGSPSHHRVCPAPHVTDYSVLATPIFVCRIRTWVHCPRLPRGYFMQGVCQCLSETEARLGVDSTTRMPGYQLLSINGRLPSLGNKTCTTAKLTLETYVEDADQDLDIGVNKGPLGPLAGFGVVESRRG